MHAGSTVENLPLVIKSSKKDFFSPQACYLWFFEQNISCMYLAYIIFSLRGRTEREKEAFTKIVLTSKYFLLPVCNFLSKDKPSKFIANF